jgi:hypothetical protein
MSNNLAFRIFRSLLMDLIIPWIISAICIVVFFYIHVALGMVGWPICFLLFLFICVMRDKMRKSTLQHHAAAADNKIYYSSEPELMEQLGIRFNGSYYTCKGYDFDKLEHAISHAEHGPNPDKNV